MKISRKLAGAFALIVAVIVALGVVVFLQVRALERAKETVALAETVTAMTGQLKRAVDQEESAVLAYMLTGKPLHVQRIETHKRAFADGAAEMKALTAHLPGASDRMDVLIKAVTAYQDAIIDPEVRLASRPETRHEALAMTESNVPTQMMDPVDAAFDGIVEAQATRKAAAVEDQSEAFKTTKIALAVGVLTALVLSILFGLGLAKMIATPIAAMTAAMRRLAGGDKTIIVPAVGRKDEVGEMADALLAFKDAAIANERLEVEAAAARRDAEEERARGEAEKARIAEEDHIAVTALGQGLQAMSNGDLTHRMTAQVAQRSEQLKTDFNTAIAQLEQAVAVVIDNVAAIRSGAGEISQASDDLSRRTEQQAASLEETAAALDQITATVNKTADGARQASSVVQQARGDAETSGNVVRDAVAAMNAIERSSTEIGNIIGVIDEIAFQTNLLALNAGVEAARAGDAGRGFAVVASEVRALAQRSAEAAKEIKTLISASGQQVGAGVNLVGQTGQALQRIVSRVAEIDGLVSEISASAQEQATGLQQVNTAVNQMDQVTQQNAAMVEESTAASHSLAQEADSLAASVARFRTGHAAPVAAVRKPTPVRTAQPVAQTVAAIRSAGGAARKPTLVAVTDGWEEF